MNESETHAEPYQCNQCGGAMGAHVKACPSETPTPRLYAERDAMDLGEYYIRHVEAMTAEGLHSKSAIAAELAWRDRELAAMTKQYNELIMEVAQKFHGETRHETALRYIRERETITPSEACEPSSASPPPQTPC